MWWPFIHKTSPRRQIDPIECGAVCLGIILHSLGRFVSNAELRKKANTSRSGSDAASIIDAAKSFGLGAQGKKITTEDLKTLRPPAILFVDGGHFVVLEGYFLQRFFINDPARGRYSLTANQMRKRFNNIAILFSRSSSLRAVTPEEDFKCNLGLATTMLLLGFSAGFLAVMLALCTGFLLSDYSEAHYRWWLIIGNLLVFFILIMTFVIAQLALRDHAERSWRQDRELMVLGLGRVPYNFFDDLPFYIFARIFADSIYRCHAQAQRVFISFVFSFGFVQLMASAFLYWPIAILWIFCLVIFFGQSIMKKSHFHHSPFYDLAFNDLVDHQDDLRLMGQEKNLINGLLKNQFDNFVNNNFILSPIKSVAVSPIIPVAIFLLLFCLITKNAWSKGIIRVEELLSLLMLGFGQTAAIFLAKKPAEVDSEASSLFLELNDAQKKIIEEKSLSSSDILIKLEKVSFSYRGEQKNVFDQCDLDLKRGSIIGIVAPPLLGTTTLLHLVAGKISPTSGVIRHFVKSHPLRIGIVDDDSMPFSGTLKDNVTLFSKEIKEEKIVWALEEACATELFYNRPLGLIAPIFSEGKNLSIGERKRLLLAQALAHSADIIILDGFFECLDEKIAKKIINNLRSLRITVVFSSYRINDLEETDQIVLIKDHHNLVISSHETLFSNNLLYQQMVVPVIEDKLL